MLTYNLDLELKLFFDKSFMCIFIIELQIIVILKNFKILKVLDLRKLNIFLATEHLS